MLTVTQRYVARGDIWNEKRLVTHCVVKPRENAEVILKTHELYIYEDMRYITKSVSKNMLEIATL
jgi:hypothetical protein